MNFMSNYYQLSTDYDQADKLLSKGLSLPAWMVFNQNPLVFNTDHKQLRVFSSSDEKLFIDGLKPPSDFTYEKYQVLFLLPIPDPTIALQHSLKLALNECDELRQKNKTLNFIIKELQSDLDTAKNDLTIANQKLESQLKEQDRTISNLEDQIDGRDAALRGSAKIIQGLNQEIERLQEASKSVQPIAHSSAERIDQLREVIDQNNKAFAQENERLLAVIEERCNKIDILEDNLDRSDSDRLSELTSIMRMLQAWESVPIQQGLGAIHLIKRVIYDAICKLDPSQAVDP
jgi:DNA repair ATPase RecN